MVGIHGVIAVVNNWGFGVCYCKLCILYMKQLCGSKLT